MESDDELQLFSPTEEPSPAVPEPKLKRLKKAVRVSSNIPTLNPSSPPVDFSKSEAVDSDESKGRDSPELNESPPPRALDSGGFHGLGGEEDSCRAKRALEFDSVADEFDGEGEDGRAEMGEGIGDLRVEEPEKKQRSPVEIDENSENKKKKKKKSIRVEGVNRQDSGGYDGLGGDEDGSVAKRALEFDSVADEFDGEGEDGRAEMGEGIGDLRVEEPEKKQRSPVEIDENSENKKKKKKKSIRVEGVNRQDSGGYDGLGGDEDGSVAKRALEFDSVADEFDGEGEDGRAEMGEGIGDLRVEEPEKKQRSPVEIDENSENKKKKKKKSIRVEGVNRQDSGGYDGLGGDEDGSVAKRALEFDYVAEEFDGEGEDLRAEMGEGIGGLRVEEPEKKRRSPVEIDEKRENKKKKRNKRVAKSVNAQETATAKRITQKERRDNLMQVRAESQRLLRETRDVSFKPVPLVQKSISSVLEKIRKRKLELSKKSVAIKTISLVDDDDDDDGFAMEVVVDCGAGGTNGDERGNNGIVKSVGEEAIEVPANTKSNSDESCKDESNHIKDHSSRESIPSQMDVDEKSRQAFRIPIEDTQELLSDSLTGDSSDELPSETPNSPLEEVLAPSILAMNLKLDSAPLDDVSDEEDNNKESVDPHPHGLSSSPDGDPVKAFVDDEAEVEDDSDNDMFRFGDNEDEDENDDFQELNDMIATEYEEKPIDNEKRNQLHQKWLEHQDAAGTENLLQKLNCGSKLNDTTLLEDEEDEEGEEDKEDFGDEASEDLIPTNIARMNLRKVKQMIPQMFTDKDDVYLSSDDEETEKRLSKQCLFEKSEEQATLLSPAEDESSRAVFGLIKKLNTAPDTKKGKTPSLFDMPFTGGKKNILSKSSFLGWGSTHSLPSSQRHASSTGRSFIFGRDESNSRSAISISEDSSDAIQRENRPTRPASAKFSNSQIKASTQNTQSVAALKSGTSLFDILRQSSLQSEHRTRDNMVLETESVFAAFKLAKKPMKTEGRA